MLLTTQLMSLKRKGYPVDRILRQPKLPRVVEKYDQEKSNQENEKTPSLNAIKNNQLESYVPQLQEMFPDCDPNYIRQCLSQQKSDHVNNVANVLAEGNYPKINTKSRQSTTVPTNSHNSGDMGMKKYGWNLLDKVKDYATGSSQVNGNVSTSTSTPSKPIETPVNKKPDSTVTPETTLNLRKSLRDAIRTCRSNSGSVIDNKASVNIVNESQSSYCDIIPGMYNI
jgi:hypothetical protein